ncbi:MAG: hypothetical protein QXS48_00495 [Candidatus Aenigmatarchaeota archaeon]
MRKLRIMFILLLVSFFLILISIPINMMLVGNIPLAIVVENLESYFISFLAFYLLPKAYNLTLRKSFNRFIARYKKYTFFLIALFLTSAYEVTQFLILTIVEELLEFPYFILGVFVSIILIIGIVHLIIKKIFVASTKIAMSIALITLLLDVIISLLPFYILLLFYFS